MTRQPVDPPTAVWWDDIKGWVRQSARERASEFADQGLIRGQLSYGLRRSCTEKGVSDG